MSKYAFHKRYKSEPMSIRVDSDVAVVIRQIAKENETTIQEVCRVLLRKSVSRYKPNSTQSKDTKRGEQDEVKS